MAPRRARSRVVLECGASSLRCSPWLAAARHCAAPGLAGRCAAPRRVLRLHGSLLRCAAVLCCVAAMCLLAVARCCVALHGSLLDCAAPLLRGVELPLCGLPLQCGHSPGLQPRGTELLLCPWPWLSAVRRCTAAASVLRGAASLLRCRGSLLRCAASPLRGSLPWLAAALCCVAALWLLAVARC